MQVEQILETKGHAVHTVRADATLADAVAALNAHGIGAVVVVDLDGRVAGILSERDVVRHLSEDWARLSVLPVATCMSRQLVTARRSASVAELMENMTNHRVRHIPVLEQGELVGLVSIGDVVKFKIAEAEQEAQALREYIAS